MSDPANIALLAAMDPNDGGLADMWSIQVKCGRRISEVVGLRFDCVSEHLGRTWMWVDMTKVGKLDYAIQIPRDIYDLIVARQAKTAERFRLAHGTEPTAQQRRTVALFPSRKTNPTFERSVSTATFAVAFKAWIESEAIALPGHTTHQARHTLATRLVHAGASMTHVKRVLGHVSERMSDSYVLIAGSQVEPFLQQVWVTGPGNPTPGQVVMTPTAAEKASAEQLMIDLAAVPTEHGLCTFKPVVGGHDCPFDRQCHTCEHFVLTGADYGYWRRQEQRWAAMAEGAPDQTARDYIYGAFEKSSLGLGRTGEGAAGVGSARPGPGTRSAQPPPGFLRPDLDPRLAGRRSGPHRRRNDRRQLRAAPRRPGPAARGHRVVNQPGGTHKPVRKPRPERAIDARRRDAAAKVTAVDKAVKAIGRTGVPVTRAGVARLAGVSRSFTYENDQADSLIEAAQSRSQTERVERRPADDSPARSGMERAGAQRRRPDTPSEQ